MRTDVGENMRTEVKIGRSPELGDRSAIATLTPGDLADLLSAFNEASTRLQRSHESLSGEVARLKSELASANEQLERSRRLAALGEMAAGIAHEVRNPLGSIRLYARMLEQDLVDRPSEQAVASKVARAVTGLDAVVGDVLSFAKELRPNTEPHGVSELFDRAWEEAYAGVASASAVSRVRCVRMDRLRGDDDAVLIADGSLVHRALVNVMRNAIEAVVERALREGSKAESAGVGPIVLDAGSVRRPSAQEQAKPWRTLVIRDSGGGLSKEASERMFNPFFTTRAAGTGLGLAIVHRIVDAHGGRIGVRNVEAEMLEGELIGSGARIEVAFPDGCGADERIEDENDLCVNSARGDVVMEDR